MVLRSSYDENGGELRAGWRILPADGITFRVNDGEWIHAQVPVGGHAEGLVLLSGAPIVINQSAGAVKIAWQGGGNNIVFPW